MDLRQLAALTAVADTGTFSAAADQLHTVQSNISTHVARLERELGVILVDRSAGRLTEEGQLVVDRARRITSELEALVADVAALRAEVAGTVRLGLIGTVGRWLAPRMLEALAAAHPKVHLVIMEGTSTSLEPQLAGGRLDLAVVHLPVPGPDLATQSLFDEDLVLVVPAGDPLAAGEPLEITALDRLPMLLPVPGTAFRDEIDAVARRAGVHLTASAELDGVRLIASLTFEGRGPAILPATAVPSFMRDDWASIPVRGLPRRHVGVAVRRRGLPSAPARAVMAVLRRVVAEDPAPPGVHPVPS